jgi:hypothetical protein
MAIARQQTVHDVTFEWLRSLPARGTWRGFVAGDSIPFLFHYTATTSFQTTFVYDRAKDSWQWHMDNDSAGARRPFARVTLTRR